MRSFLATAFAVFLLALPAAAQEVYRLELTGPITPVTAEFFEGALAEANAGGARVILIRIDTPGGLVSAVEEIQRDILQSEAPVVAWVGPVNARAASGGALVALACDLVAMAPGTTIGSAHPVLMSPIPLPQAPQEQPGGQDGGKGAAPAPGKDVMMEKILNDLSAHARSLAENRGRSVEAYEKMLRESISLTEKESLAQGAVEMVAASEAEVLDRVRATPVKRFDGTLSAVALSPAPAIKTLVPSARLRFLGFLADPNLAFVLLLLGVLGLYVEFKAPGLIFPGILGGIFVLLFLFSTTILPVNAVGVLLILLGVTFLILELKVVSYGMLAVGGIVSLLIGGLTLYRGSPVPELRVSFLVLIPVVAAFAAIILFLVALALRAFKNPVMTGDESLVGQVGAVSQPLGPGRPGKVFVFGEYWEATADEELAAGAKIVVAARHGMVLHVRGAAQGGGA